VTVCALCQDEGGVVLVRQAEWRLVRALDTPAFPATYRVIWNDHLAEWTDLDLEQRRRCMDVVAQVERLMREHLAPTKVNLASLGNVVAHVHWHVMARFDWDSHFPAPVWAAPLRAIDDVQQAELAVRLSVLDQAFKAHWA
jgi:diadenosine tetraphosphate (Ap4A) HIT family hydrolase